MPVCFPRGPGIAQSHCFANSVTEVLEVRRGVWEAFPWHRVSVFSLLQEHLGVRSSCPPVPILSAQPSHSDNRSGMLLALKSPPAGPLSPRRHWQSIRC